MKFETIMRSAIVAGGVALGGGAMATSPAAEMLANTCAGCHGTDGSSQGPATPSLAGMKDEYFVESMMAYKEGTRPGTIMGRIARAYSDEQISLMAGFFGGQTFVRIGQPADARLARQGGRVHERYCEKCHEDGGRLSDDGGILAGQMTPYLRHSFDDFISGRREMPEDMKTKVEEMLEKVGADGFEQLVHYYGSQK